MDHEGARWFKSSYSGGSGTECVEAAFTTVGTFVRDSERPSSGHFHVGRGAWAHFVGSVREGALH
ncbi:DUF397 domain-containing protein [Streptomyces sp. P01-B04]|uniref:DUF397 domain-containing protein n=1 Tax=Streptomyces poriferorum TaxID=2798799 RepID=A0ABY9IXU4_9ACTN|nr:MULTISPECIES: DUF397 domain-containing protein [Streptomyces]MBW5252761.1 DUF397 domain-containing protein [Streptomyces poriferorum]MBW5261813.1 DUF397 domain-containing protein [Streptomyces poriferorum]MDP5312149.1 DUF397 domain-containing protein [Streptomyces sp. Alt4]WLQ58798.1 DUF397 domain-containing protein [Streptomyces sp. Alt2]